MVSQFTCIGTTMHLRIFTRSIHVTDARYVQGYTIWLRFNNGAEGEVDLRGELEGEVFGPLADVELFQRFHVDPELNTIVWENGADLAPEYLYENMTVLT